MINNKNLVKKYSCTKCENEWPPIYIKKFEMERSEFINSDRKKFSFQCPICKAWLNGVLCFNCRKCVLPHENCPKCGFPLEPPLAGCRR